MGYVRRRLPFEELRSKCPELKNVRNNKKHNQCKSNPLCMMIITLRAFKRHGEMTATVPTGIAKT